MITGIEVADLDGDSDLDVVSGGYSGLNIVLRGMYDGFIADDIDGDGNLDMISTRGNSGNLDGVFWLEQLRSPRPLPADRPMAFEQKDDPVARRSG